MQAMKHSGEGIQPDFETEAKHHQKPKTGVSVAQKGLMFSKIFTKKEQKIPL